MNKTLIKLGSNALKLGIAFAANEAIRHTVKDLSIELLGEVTKLIRSARNSILERRQGQAV